jgi:hypothetical protein
MVDAAGQRGHPQSGGQDGKPADGDEKRQRRRRSGGRRHLEISGLAAGADFSAVFSSQPLNDLAMDFDDTRRWQLKADGLHIVYPAYELGSYLSQAETLLDWKTLKPYLRQDLPFRPQDLQSAVEGVVY